MRRVTIIGISFAVGIATVLAAIGTTSGRRLLALGDRLDDRTYFGAAARRRFADRPFVVWMGDSTIMAIDQVSYPQLIDTAIKPAFENVIVAYAGFDFYHYYFLLGDVLAQKPDLVVMIAHLRLFDPRGRWSRPCGDFASMLPASELLRATRLPLHERGITVPRLLIARALCYPNMMRATHLFTGLRAAFRDAGFWGVLGPETERRTLVQHMRVLEAGRGMLLGAYDGAIGPRHPVVRMMAAAVDMASRRGVATLVIASPIPYQFLQQFGRYDAGRFARRIGILRRVVEQAGGRFLDLHTELEQREFRDNAGHYNADGAAHVARVVEPAVRSTLGHRLRLPEPVVAERPPAPIPATR